MPLIREAKSRYGIRYIPLIYDLIPMITPEYCGQDLVAAFGYWINSVFSHADLILAISKSTQQDVIKAADGIKHLTRQPIIVPLDAEFGMQDGAAGTADRAGLLDGFGLRNGFYVLVVGTLEIRKNQMLIFQAWAKLIELHGAAAMPTLVCVGKIGHGFEFGQNFLRSHPELQDKVIMLSGLSDVELNALYADCLFTAFASTYEGWGLPVTESLCHGKVCLSADHSSLPEAGGVFADYFEANSVKSFVQHAERLLFDHDYRQAREHQIVAEFRPRPWHDVLAGLVDGIETHCVGLVHAEPLVAPISFGEIYDIGQDHRARRPDKEGAIAEMLRYDGTWHPLESWGVWANKKYAKLAFRLPPLEGPADDLILYLKLCAPNSRVAVTVKVAGQTQLVTIDPDESLAIRLQIPFKIASNHQDGGPMIVHLDIDDLVAPVDIADTRRLGVGFQSFALCRTGDTAARLRIIERSIKMSSNLVAAA
ncbi:glycosyltransferase family 1 protein [Acidisphaera sp. L21]|uniref:glycosyltransferase family 4 protein n=1 Tax=Acidisphaera sp. L21 TaxID=1641851 RepID=UPI00131B7AC8|nr:glycosyltransferase family 1 protein [Acidisphaera sp. L21]